MVFLYLRLVTLGFDAYGGVKLLHCFLFQCCDHPYLVDPSLVTFVNKGRPAVDSLSTGIEVSGKLLLLDKFLQEVWEKQLRVVIVFQVC